MQSLQINLKLINKNQLKLPINSNPAFPHHHSHHPTQTQTSFHYWQLYYHFRQCCQHWSSPPYLNLHQINCYLHLILRHKGLIINMLSAWIILLWTAGLRCIGRGGRSCLFFGCLSVGGLSLRCFRCLTRFIRVHLFDLYRSWWKLQDNPDLSPESTSSHTKHPNIQINLHFPVAQSHNFDSTKIVKCTNCLLLTNILQKASYFYWFG